MTSSSRTRSGIHFPVIASEVKQSFLVLFCREKYHLPAMLRNAMQAGKLLPCRSHSIRNSSPFTIRTDFALPPNFCKQNRSLQLISHRFEQNGMFQYSEICNQYSGFVNCFEELERPGPFWGAGKIGKDVLGCWDWVRQNG